MHEIGDHAPVVGAHAGSVGVEDADDAGVHAAATVVRHGNCLGVAFGLVVAGAHADGVHIAPVRLGLRVHKGVTVHLTGAGQEEPGAVRVGKFQAVLRTLRADHQGFHGELLVVGGTGRAGEVHHPVELLTLIRDAMTDVRLDEREPWMLLEQFSVAALTADVVVDADDGVALVEEAFDKVTADEACASGDQDAQRLAGCGAGHRLLGGFGHWGSFRG